MTGLSPSPDMGVQHDAAITRQRHRFHKGLAVAIDRLARCDHDLPHAERAGVVIAVDQAGAIGDELVGRFQHLVGDGGPLRFRQRIAAATGMEAHAEEIRRLELAIDQPFSGVAGKIILVVEGRGAAMLDQLGHCRDRGMVEASPRSSCEKIG